KIWPPRRLRRHPPHSRRGKNERVFIPSSIEEGWRPKTAEVVRRSGPLCVRQKELQQIVEKALPQIRRPDALVVPRDESARLGLSQRLFCNCDLQPGAFHER